jgi:hypothetical protein
MQFSADKYMSFMRPTLKVYVSVTDRKITAGEKVSGSTNLSHILSFSIRSSSLANSREFGMSQLQ